MNFIIDDEQMVLINAWCDKQDKIAAEEQAKDAEMCVLRDDLGMTLPYYGATGGQLQFIFTPCSIGVAQTVKHLWTKNTLDITDYAGW
jgi:hypothetical protein